MNYYNLAVNDSYLQRLDAAASTLADAAKRGLDEEELRMLEYALAFLRRETAALNRIVSQTRQRPDAVSRITNREAFRAAYAGHLQQAQSIPSRSLLKQNDRTSANERARGKPEKHLVKQ